VSGSAGVSWNSQDERWRAQIRADTGDGKSKTRYLGSFVKQVGAARAYDQAAREYHGNRAKLNFPDPSPKPMIPSSTPQPLPPGFEGPYLDAEGLWLRPTQEHTYSASCYMGESLGAANFPQINALVLRRWVSRGPQGQGRSVGGLGSHARVEYHRPVPGHVRDGERGGPCLQGRRPDPRPRLPLPR
jgi:hypothetical protein